MSVHDGDYGRWCWWSQFIIMTISKFMMMPVHDYNYYGNWFWWCQFMIGPFITTMALPVHVDCVSSWCKCKLMLMWTQWQPMLRWDDIFVHDADCDSWCWWQFMMLIVIADADDSSWWWLWHLKLIISVHDDHMTIHADDASSWWWLCHLMLIISVDDGYDIWS